MSHKPGMPPLTAAEIAAEIRQTRSRLSNQLTRLDREYPLRYVILQALRLRREPALDLAGLRDALRADIVPFALIALGVTWLEFRGAGQSRSMLEGATRLIGRLRELTRPSDQLPSTSPSEASPSKS